MNGKRMWGVAAVMALSLACATSLQAQSTQTDWTTRIARAEALADYAVQLACQRAEFDEASSLLREAASLRGKDSEAVHNLIQAGHFAYYAGQGLRAVSALRSAGEVAVATGDLMTAAEAFMDAAWVANLEGEKPTAMELFERGQELMRITQEQPQAR